MSEAVFRSDERVHYPHAGTATYYGFYYSGNALSRSCNPFEDPTAPDRCVQAVKTACPGLDDTAAELAACLLTFWHFDTDAADLMPEIVAERFPAEYDALVALLDGSEWPPAEDR